MASTTCGRLFSISGGAIDVYLDEATAQAVRGAFRLLLRDAAGQRLSADPARASRSRRASPSRLTGQGGAITVLPFQQDHGDIASLGFRFGGLAYSTDVNGVPAEALRRWPDLDVWIVDALRYRRIPAISARRTRSTGSSG